MACHVDKVQAITKRSSVVDITGSGCKSMIKQYQNLRPQEASPLEIKKKEDRRSWKTRKKELITFGGSIYPEIELTT